MPRRDSKPKSASAPTAKVEQRGKGPFRKTHRTVSLSVPIDWHDLDATLGLCSAKSGDHVVDYLSAVRDAADRWLAAHSITIGDGAAIAAYRDNAKHAKHADRADEFNELALRSKNCLANYASDDPSKVRSVVFQSIRIEELRCKLAWEFFTEGRGRIANFKAQEKARGREAEVREAFLALPQHLRSDPGELDALAAKHSVDFKTVKRYLGELYEGRTRLPRKKSSPN